MLLVLTPLFGALLLLIWFGQYQLQRDTAAQADAVGAELARQVAASVADPLAADDHLSLNILLAQWNQNPLIAHTSLTTPDNRIVAEAGGKVSAAQLAPGQGRFVTAVHVQDVLAGQLRLSLAAEPFSAPGQALVRHLLWSLLGLTLLGALLAWRMAAGMRKVLNELADWHGDTDSPPAGLDRADELGDLARRLTERRIVDMPAPAEPEELDEPEDAFGSDSLEPATMELANQPNTAQAPASLDSVPDPDTVFGPVEQEPVDENADADAFTVRSEAEISDGDDETFEEESRDQALRPDIAGSSRDVSSNETEAVTEPVAPPPAPAIPGAVLAVRLGNQEALRRLARPRLLSLLERYREHVSQAAEIYQGKLQTLHDGTSVISFADDAGKDDAEELTRVLSCGELLRVLGHDLQIEIADTGIALHLQLAACRTENIDELEDDAYTEQPDCKQMLERLQFSRNLVLLDASLATTGILGQRAVVRRLASQSGVYCVERLKEPHQTLLERQLNALYTQRRN
ncbi:MULTISPECIES: hypothetical protein [Pseudomonas]|uniref:hypothetical protein n=1 Tax=Pseudomonas TaxID=286 RepID=UPI00123AEC15|nr:MULTISPECIES: hypothetical protein [Pseudomonas]QIB52971.1 hypothetical protein G3M63_19110 [Pseudomonas sp. OIL-1]